MTKYQIFISSTYVDLKEARRKVQDAILSIKHFPVGMEYFGAANEDQWSHIKEEIDNSDYYILILGRRYGSVISEGEDKGLSYTEKEYRYAVKRGIPVLAFLLSDSAVVDARYTETEKDKIEALEKFKASVSGGRLVDFWENEFDLAYKVTFALHNEIIKDKRPGWVRQGAVVQEAECEGDVCDNPELEIVEALAYGHGALEFSELMEYTLLPEKQLRQTLERMIAEGRVEKSIFGSSEMYKYFDPRHPISGRHTVKSDDGRVLSEGLFENGELSDGVEYDWIIRDDEGLFVYNPETKDYDGETDIPVSKYMQFYDDMTPFYWVVPHLMETGLDGYYMSDIRVKDGGEEFYNIRPLRVWLAENAPKKLREVEENIKEA